MVAQCTQALSDNKTPRILRKVKKKKRNSTVECGDVADREHDCIGIWWWHGRGTAGTGSGLCTCAARTARQITNPSTSTSRQQRSSFCWVLRTPFACNAMQCRATLWPIGEGHRRSAIRISNESDAFCRVCICFGLLRTKGVLSVSECPQPDVK